MFRRGFFSRRRNFGQMLLGLYLILLGVQPMLRFSVPGGALTVELLAVLAGVFLLLER